MVERKRKSKMTEESEKLGSEAFDTGESEREEFEWEESEIWEWEDYEVEENSEILKGKSEPEVAVIRKSTTTKQVICDDCEIIFDAEPELIMYAEMCFGL